MLIPHQWEKPSRPWLRSCATRVAATTPDVGPTKSPRRIITCGDAHSPSPPRPLVAADQAGTFGPRLTREASDAERSTQRNGGGEMGNSDDRRELFEVARAYRAVYDLRSAYDRQPVLTVSAAIAYGELMLRADRLPIPADPAASAR